VCEWYDGRAWYCLTDPKNDSRYYVPADDLRPIFPEEYSPIARDVDADSKRIVVSLEEQTLTAYEGDRIALRTTISSGLPSPDLPPDEIPTDTPKGYFWITQKMASRHMGNGRLTSQIDAYELPGVPWTMAFHETGAAMHGSFWHNNFGRRMSHGCINMRNSEAMWLFRWTDPVFDPSNWYTNGLGTRIQVV
jgi:lipoprotein-anchoring transpeptidase ErfK/SrfK